MLDATATGRRLSLAATPASPYDAVAALDALLGRLRAASGANRVAVWLHEATTRTVVPFARATCETTAPIEDPRVRSPLALSRTVFLSAVVDGPRAVLARDDDPGPVSYTHLTLPTNREV